MPEFDYRAASQSGQVQNGRLSAGSREEALRQLRGKGLTPIRLIDANPDVAITAAPVVAATEKKTGAASIGRLFKRDRPPGFHDVHDLTGELSIMLRAGLPLDRSLKVLIGMSQKPSLTVVLEDLLKAVKSGKGLSQALQPHQPLFGTFYISMVRSGEAAGHLSEALEQMAEHLERLKSLRDSVISAMVYPAILLAVAVISVFLLLGYVVPQFEPLFKDLGDGLPTPTRVIVALGHLVSDWGWLLLLLTALCVWLSRRWLATETGQTWKDTHMLRIPVFGNIIRKYEITRFARSMGTLLKNGVPIVNAIRIASNTMGNRILRTAIDNVAPAIKQGGRMADALTQAGLFTPLTLNMVKLGEETGRLDDMLLEVAKVHDLDVQSGIKRGLTLVEPLLILTLGMVIAMIIVSILMGIMSVNDLAGV